MKRSFKQLVGISLAGLVLSLIALPVQAITVQDIVNPRQNNNTWVTDSAEILQPDTETQLNQMIDRLEQQNGSEIAVVTVPETKPAKSPKAFATELFNHWQIGKKDQNNGVLILISKAERRVEIETGKGIAAILPDAQVVNVINTKMLPRFKQSDFNGGTIAGTQSIVSSLDPALNQDLAVPDGGASMPAATPEQPKPSGNNWDVIWGFLVISFFILLLPVFLFLVIFGNKIQNKPASGKGSSNSDYHGYSDSGSGGYSDGGGGFGGGGSDGGGGGGSW